MAKYTYKSIHKALKKYGVMNDLHKDYYTHEPVDVSTPLNENVYAGYFTFDPSDDGYHVDVHMMNYDDEGYSSEMIKKQFRTVKEASEFINKFYELMDIIPEIDYDDNNPANIVFIDDDEYDNLEQVLNDNYADELK